MTTINPPIFKSQTNRKAIFVTDEETADTAFAIYYGKFQGIAPKASRIISLIESRVEQNVEYEYLLNELHKLYLFQRASVRFADKIHRITESNGFCFLDYEFRSRVGH